MSGHTYHLNGAFGEEVKISFTGYKGGDAGHGAKLKIAVKHGGFDEFETLTIEGDGEISSTIKALKEFITMLEEEKNESTIRR